MATYWEKLKDPRWQKKRLEIFERDNWTCKMCGETSETLHVHHGFYDRGCDPWDYQNDTLHTLCEGCHESAQSTLRDVHCEIAQIHPTNLDPLLWLLQSLHSIRSSNAPEVSRQTIESTLWYMGLLSGDIDTWEQLSITNRLGELEENTALGMGCSA